jgi:hypothetical protein
LIHHDADSESSPWSSWWIFFVVVFGIIAIERAYTYGRRAYRKYKGLEGFQPIQMMNEFNDMDEADMNETGYGYSGHSSTKMQHSIHVYGDEKNQDDEFDDHAYLSSMGNASNNNQRRVQETNQFHGYTPEPFANSYDDDDNEDEFHVHTKNKIGGGI